MKTEFALAFKQVINDKNLPEEIIIEALQDAMVSAYRRSVNASSAQKVEAEIDLETGEVTIFVEKEVVDDVMDDRTEVLIAEARKVNKDTEYGDLEMVESTPEDFGRVAARLPVRLFNSASARLSASLNMNITTARSAR